MAKKKGEGFLSFGSQKGQPDVPEAPEAPEEAGAKEPAAASEETSKYLALPDEVRKSTCPVCGTVGPSPCVVDGFHREDT